MLPHISQQPVIRCDVSIDCPFGLGQPWRDRMDVPQSVCPLLAGSRAADASRGLRGKRREPATGRLGFWSRGGRKWIARLQQGGCALPIPKIVPRAPLSLRKPDSTEPITGIKALWALPGPWRRLMNGLQQGLA